MTSAKPWNDATPRPDSRDTGALLRDAALEQSRKSLRTGYDPYYRRHYSYVQPSPGRYRWMWFWDTCFHVAALSRLDTDMARTELEDLLATQDPDGFIGHIVYWGRLGALRSAVYTQSRFGAWRSRHSHMIQPPLLAQATERLYLRLKPMDEVTASTFLQRVLPRVDAYYGWLWRVRLDRARQLIGIVSPFEAGTDNSPAFDAPMGLNAPGRAGWLYRLRLLDFRNALCARPALPSVSRRPAFLVYELLTNYASADGMRALSRLHTALSNGDSANRWKDRAAAVEDGVNEHLWDQSRGLYYSLDARTGRRLEISTAVSLLPALLDSTPPDRRFTVVDRHLRNPAEFWLDYPVPSVARSEPSFDPAGQSMIWRGPAAVNLNWLFVHGLRRAGLADEASHIAERSAEMATRSGFREFYNPLTGEGLRGTNFGWATAVVDMREP